jgi:hypothetical protein
MCTHLESPRQEEITQLPRRYRSDVLSSTPVPPTAANAGGLTIFDVVAGNMGRVKRQVKRKREETPRCNVAATCARTAHRACNIATRTVSHCNTGVVALDHGACRVAPRGCRNAPRGVSQCTTGGPHCDTGGAHVRTEGATLPHGRVSVRRASGPVARYDDHHLDRRMDGS